MRALAVVVFLYALAGAASAQTPCPSGTTAKRIACLDTALAAEQSARATADREGRDADAAIRLRLADQAAKIEELSARVAALEETGGGPTPTPSPPGPGLPTPPPAGPANFPDTSDGKPITQLGLFWWRYWNFEEPFVDLMRENAGDFTVTLHGGARVPFRELWAAGHIDKATGWPKSQPANAFVWTLGAIRHGAPRLPAAYADTYVATWEGDADIRIARECASASDMNCQRRAGANRVEATFDMAALSLVEMTRMGPGGVRNVKVFRKRNEAALAAGKILNPVFRDHARRYKVLRFMDVQEASHGRPFRPGDFARFDYATWSPQWTGPADAPKQPSWEAIFRTAVETDTAAWVHVAGLPGAPAAFDALIEPAASDLWNEACRTHLATILASPDWGVYMDAIVAGLAAGGYPANRTLYLEPWNEVWNWGGPWARMTHCARGVWAARSGPADQMDYRWGYGFLSAKVQREFDAALARAGRAQRWVLVLAGQNANTTTTTAALEGFKAYWRTAGLTDAETRQRLAYVGVSVSSYYDGSLSRSGGFVGAASDADHLAAVKAAIANGAASRLRREWLTGPPRSTWGPNIAAMVANRAAHRRIAESYGAFFLGDYEGESHDNLPAYLKADPVVARWNEEFLAGPDGEATTRRWREALVADDADAVISNYMGAWPRLPGDDPWYDGYYGEGNGRIRALDGILRPPR